MTAPDRWRRIEDLYHAALAREEGERGAFLRDACAADEPLRREVESLLACAPAAEGVLNEPAAQVAARALADDTGASWVGRRVGVYEILARLGAGGMGEVYRARDTKLGRDVAIKVLPPISTLDPDRRARFDREARALAALNHPHIAAIYQLAEGGGVPVLVLELVEGETLAARIGRGRLPVPDALAIARQIADALEAAHEKGIIHRDLKPANIVVAPDGTGKILDFGLAKALGGEGAGVDLSQSPTVSLGGTGAGVILGTPAYMSPEQARGKPVDKRTDIWAFGCVLYEMLAGTQAFAGETITDVIAKILERDPDWERLPDGTPAIVRHLLRRCLQKDPRRRLRDIGDACAELDEAITPPVASARETGDSGSRSRSRRLLWVAAALPLVAVIIFALVWRARSGRAPASLDATFTQITAQPGIEWFPSLSPDGKWVAYAGNTEGNRDIYLQSVTGQTPINLTKDSPADDDQPAFSPDGESIAFRSSREGGGIFAMGRTGESVRRITRMGFHPTWSPDGSALAFSAANVDISPQNATGARVDAGLWTVSLNGGEPRRIDEATALQPTWSPHGTRIAYAIPTGAPRHVTVMTIPAGGGTPTSVTPGRATDWSPAWSADGKYLFFTSDRGGSMNLWRVAIDEASGRPLAEPEPITTPAPFATHVSVSADARRIAYSAVIQTQNIQRLTFDPATATVIGEPASVTAGSRLWSSPDPSPDGHWVAFYSRIQPEGDIYVVRSDGTGLRQVTGGAAIDRVPRWSPDGSWLTWFSNRSGTLQLWKIRPDGSELQRLTDTEAATYPVWSPDGTRIAFSDLQTRSVYVFDPNRPWRGQTVRELPPRDRSAPLFEATSWSPDGERLVGDIELKTIATVAVRTGQMERLTDFGEAPAWLSDSRRILFVAGGKDLFVVDAQTKAVRKIYSAMRDVIGPPRLTRDNREIFLSRRSTEADVWIATLR